MVVTAELGARAATEPAAQQPLERPEAEMEAMEVLELTAGSVVSPLVEQLRGTMSPL